MLNMIFLCLMFLIYSLSTMTLFHFHNRWFAYFLAARWIIRNTFDDPSTDIYLTPRPNEWKCFVGRQLGPKWVIAKIHWTDLKRALWAKQCHFVYGFELQLHLILMMITIIFLKEITTFMSNLIDQWFSSDVKLEFSWTVPVPHKQLTPILSFDVHIWRRTEYLD